MCYTIDVVKREFLTACESLTTQALVDLFDELNRKSVLGDHLLLSDEEVDDFRKRYQKLIPNKLFFVEQAIRYATRRPA